MTTLESIDAFIAALPGRVQTIVLDPDLYRFAVEEAMKDDADTQVRFTPNKHLVFIRKGTIVMKGQHKAVNLNEGETQ